MYLTLMEKLFSQQKMDFYTYDDITDRFYRYDQLNNSLGSFAVSTKIIPALGRKFWFINYGKVAIADFSANGKITLNTNWFSLLNGRMIQSYENISRINTAIYLISVDDGFVIFNDGDASKKTCWKASKRLNQKGRKYIS